MYKKITRTAEIDARLNKEGKVTRLNSSDDMSRLTYMNEYMDEIRRDYHIKESSSQISASHVVLNA